MVVGGCEGNGGLLEIEVDNELPWWWCCWGVDGDEIGAGVDMWCCRRDGVGGVGGGAWDWGMGVAVRSDVGVNGVQNVGWRRVVAVVAGWNNVPNCVVVVVVAAAGVPEPDSKIGFNLDGPKVK